MFSTIALPDIEDNTPPTSEYTRLPVSEEDEAVADSAPLKTKALSIGEKWVLLKPLLPRYMAPLCKCRLSFVRLIKLLTSRPAQSLYIL